jgi:hypothetical protein
LKSVIVIIPSPVEAEVVDVIFQADVDEAEVVHHTVEMVSSKYISVRCVTLLLPVHEDVHKTVRSELLPILGKIRS